MDVRILGPFEVRTNGRSLDLGGPRPRALLAVLALRVGEVVSSERLIDDIWGDRPPPSAQHLLHVYVSRLRKAIGPRLVTRAPGYALDLPADGLDARRFERQLGEGRRLLAGGSPEPAAAALREALALWRGAALADFAYEPFAQTEIARLEELRVVAVEERIEADLALGRHEDLVAELQALVAEHPLREVPRRQLMVALYRGGRQADALETFQEARRVLLDELGLEPGPSLQHLQQAILRHDEALQPEPRAPARRVAAAASRKLVTVLDAALVESPALDALDPEARRAVVARALDSVAAVLARHGAAVERALGESLTGVFGVPVVHEDDALRAVRAASEARAALVDASAELEREWGIRLTGRFGVETGEVVVDAEAIAGDALPRAARTRQAAARGEVLVGDATYRLVRHAVLGETDARLGRLECWRLLAVLPEAPTFAPVESPLVGRVAELTALREAFERVARERSCALATVVGEAGIGKSRLAQELVAVVGDRAITLVGRCLAYGDGITFWPLREVVRAVAGGETKDAVSKLLPDDGARDAVAGRIAAALGSSEEGGTREETFRAFRTLFEAIAAQRPLLLVFEDVHWGEPTFLDLLEYLVAWTRKSPILVVCLARPEFRDQRPDWPEEGTLLLEPLSDDDAGLLLAHLASDASLPAAARGRLVTAAEGNPLFLEQMLAMVGESERFHEELTLPPTIRAVLAARLDRLGPSERALLERAAVVGREFSLEGVLELLPAEARATAARHLQALVTKQFAQPSPSSAPAVRDFRFRHVLIQEAAYRSIPKEVRADLHERLGDWLEREATPGEDVEEIVGYHLELAYRSRSDLVAVGTPDAELAARAAARLGAAGRRAFAREDLPAAANLLSRAASLLPSADRARVELLPVLGKALADSGETERAAAVLADAVACAEALGHRAVRMQALLVAAELDMHSAEGLAQAERVADEALAFFGEFGDDRGLARGWRLLAFVHFARGRGAAHREALERALELAKAIGDEETEGECLSHICYSLGLEAVSVDEAADRAEQFHDWAVGTGNPLREADAVGSLVAIRAMQGRFAEARELVVRMRAILEEFGHRVALVKTAWDAGLTELLADDPAAAEAELRRGHEAAAAVGLDPRLLPQLGEALYRLGRYDEAERLATVGVEQLTDVGVQVLARAVRAKALARNGRAADAEVLAREAVALARGIDYVEALGTALTSLAEVLELTGHRADACAAAAEAVGLYERKGNVARAAQAGRLLARLEATPSSASAGASGRAPSPPRAGRAPS